MRKSRKGSNIAMERNFERNALQRSDSHSSLDVILDDTSEKRDNSRRGERNDGVIDSDTFNVSKGYNDVSLLI
jgi:hypothetical protein